MANSEYIYIGCKHAENALGEGGHSRRNAEAFGFAIYIKARLGHSAAKKEQIEGFYKELQIGARRKKRLVSDIVKLGYGRLCKNGTLVIGNIKAYKSNSMRIDRERITSCSKISSLIFIIREIAFVNHIHKQCQVNYFKRNLQAPKNLSQLKQARRVLRESVHTDKIYESWGFRSISRLLHSGKKKTYHLIDSLVNRGIIRVEKGILKKILDNAYNIAHIGDDLKFIFFSEMKNSDGRGLIVYKGSLYSIDANKYFLTKDMNIVRFISRSKKYSSPCYACR